MLQTTNSGAGEQGRGRAPAGLQYFGLIPAAIVVAALYFGRPVLLPLAIAVLLAFALAPFVARLRHFGVGRISSVLLSAALTIALVAAIGMFVGQQVMQLTDQLPLYQENLVQKIQTIRGTTVDGGFIGRASAMLKTLRDQVTGTPPDISVPQPRTRNATAPAPVPVEIRQPDATPLDLFLNIASPLVAPLAAAGIVLIFMIFILLHKEDLRDRFIRLAGSGDMQRTKLLLDEGAEKLSHYLLMQTAMNFTFGFVIGIGLWLIGIPNPALWGLVVTILRFVPYIGVPLAALLPIVLALSVDPGWSMLLQTILLFTACELLVGQAIEPWLYGRKMGLSPVAVVISATFWTWLWGPLGLLLSTPMTMCLVVLGRHVEHLQFLDVLLGDRPALAAEEALYLRMLSEDADEAVIEAEEFLKENSLPRYYSDVVLKALGLAQADLNRGALDPERIARITDTTQTLIQDLSDVDYGATNGAVAATQGLPARPSAGPSASVLCVGGRGALDEAAASLLENILAEKGIGVRIVAGRDLSAANLSTDRRIVCLCYLDPGNLARPRYLMRRIRRHMPGVDIIAAFWHYTDDNNDVSKIMGCDVVTDLEKAAERITVACAPDIPHNPLHQARTAPPRQRHPH
ncbi:MAG TPA: AI-2E family transporter [Micropepsaceae bacterium]|jgi:predicted PurR-regulated permease PerM|nr:AI-2E family transporter [Micropepsaceae bacterium]